MTSGQKFKIIIEKLKEHLDNVNFTFIKIGDRSMTIYKQTTKIHHLFQYLVFHMRIAYYVDSLWRIRYYSQKIPTKSSI